MFAHIPVPASEKNQGTSSTEEWNHVFGKSKCQRREVRTTLNETGGRER